MSSNDFLKVFKRMMARYPGFNLSGESIKECAAIYFDALKDYSGDLIRIAFERAIKLSPNFFPPLGLLENCCESARIESDESLHYPKARFHAHDHGCGLEGKRIQMSRARRMLFEIEPYEGIHVCCHGPFKLRCPWCGVDVAPFVNPFIAKIMEIWPDETYGWSTWHKGTLLCGNCERIEYPKGLLMAEKTPGLLASRLRSA